MNQKDNLHLTIEESQKMKLIFPVEIWSHILDLFFHSNTDFLNIALTSKAFYAYARKIFWQSFAMYSHEKQYEILLRILCNFDISPKERQEFYIKKINNYLLNQNLHIKNRAIALTLVAIYHKVDESQITLWEDINVVFGILYRQSDLLFHLLCFIISIQNQNNSAYLSHAAKILSDKNWIVFNRYDSKLFFHAIDKIMALYPPESYYVFSLMKSNFLKVLQSPSIAVPKRPVHISFLILEAFRRLLSKMPGAYKGCTFEYFSRKDSDTSVSELFFGINLSVELEQSEIISIDGPIDVSDRYLMSSLLSIDSTNSFFDFILKHLDHQLEEDNFDFLTDVVSSTYNLLTSLQQQKLFPKINVVFKKNILRLKNEDVHSNTLKDSLLRSMSIILPVVLPFIDRNDIDILLKASTKKLCDPNNSNRDKKVGIDIRVILWPLLSVDQATHILSVEYPQIIKSKCIFTEHDLLLTLRKQGMLSNDQISLVVKCLSSNQDFLKAIIRFYKYSCLEISELKELINFFYNEAFKLCLEHGDHANKCSKDWSMLRYYWVLLEKIGPILSQDQTEKLVPIILSYFNKEHLAPFGLSILGVIYQKASQEQKQLIVKQCIDMSSNKKDRAKEFLTEFLMPAKPKLTHEQATTVSVNFLLGNSSAEMYEAAPLIFPYLPDKEANKLIEYMFTYYKIWPDLITNFLLSVKVRLNLRNIELLEACVDRSINYSSLETTPYHIFDFDDLKKMNTEKFLSYKSGNFSTYLSEMVTRDNSFNHDAEIILNLWCGQRKMVNELYTLKFNLEEKLKDHPNNKVFFLSINSIIDSYIKRLLSQNEIVETSNKRERIEPR